MTSKSFETVPINLTGPSYQSRSLPISAQRTVNFYPEQNKGGISEFTLMPWPGAKPFSTGNDPDRGMHVFKGALYHVSGQSLYKVSSVGVKTLIGTISGTRRCVMSNNGFVMVICNGSVPYSYDGATLTSLTDITFNPKIVDYLNNQFIFDGDDNLYTISNVGTTTIDAANSAAAESAPDDLILPKVFNQILYNYGTATIEPSDNTGVGSPPFERMDGGIIESVGIQSPYGVCNTSDAMYFIGTDGIAYRVISFQAEPISPPAVSNALQSYDLSDVQAFSVTFEGQRFCVFNFPTSAKTWVYAESIRDWFELETDGLRYLASSYIYAYNKHYIADYRNGNIYELDLDTYTENAQPVTRERILQVIAGETFGKPRRRIEMSKFRIALEAGVGLSSGQGENPQIMVQPSYDGGRTWGQEYWIEVGRLGEFETDVEWHNMASFKQLVIRLKMTDPVKWVLYDASIDIREAGF